MSSDHFICPAACHPPCLHTPHNEAASFLQYWPLITLAFLKLFFKLLPTILSFFDVDHCSCLVFGWEACGISAPWPGIEPVTPALESEILTIGPPGKPYEGPLLAMSTRGSSWGLFYGDINPQPRDLIKHRRAHLQIPTHRWWGSDTNLCDANIPSIAEGTPGPRGWKRKSWERLRPPAAQDMCHVCFCPY